MKNRFLNYIELIRFDKPAGTLLLFWPCCFGVILSQISTAPYDVMLARWEVCVKWLLLFLAGSFCLRSAGCVINDIWDRKIDAQVERTKNRPIASGRVSVLEALCVLGIMLLGGLLIFLQLNDFAKIVSILGLLIATIYPAMKRIFSYPQFVLGLCFNIGILVASAQLRGDISKMHLFLYAGCVFWTLGYDTIYAMQDKKDDERIGIKTTTVSFGQNPKNVVAVCYFIWFLSLISLLPTFLLEQSWFKWDYQWIFWWKLKNNFLIFLPIFLYILYNLKNLEEGNSAKCMAFFKNNAYYIGIMVSLGLVLLTFITERAIAATC